MTSDAARRAWLPALRQRNFGLFWTGQLISGTGTWMQTVAMAWLVLDISHSAATLGTVTTLQFLPMLLFVLPAGVLADRVPKRRLLLATQALAAVQALTLGILAAHGTPRIWQLAVLAFVLGVSNAFNNPTQQAFVSEMVDAPLVPEAVALNSVQFNTTRMVGSALGGLAIAQFSPAAVFFANAATFAAPLLARNVLHVQAVGFGALMAAFGAGALIAGIALVVLRGGSERRMVGAGAVLAGVLVLLGMSHSYPVSLTLMGLAGISGTVFTTTANTRLQLFVPDQLRGRVMGLFVLLMAGTTPIGASLLGQGAAAFGVPATMVAFGLATAAGIAVLAARARSTRRTSTGRRAHP